MTRASPLSTSLFVLIVLTVAAAFALAWRRSAAGSDRWWPAAPLLIAAGWLVLPGALALAGALDRYSPLPAPALVLVGVVSIATAALAFSSVGDRLAAGVPLAGLVGFQAFRVPLEWLLHRLHVEGVIPVEMTYAGRNLDVVSGLTAAVLALWLRTGRRAPGLVIAWNLLGLALLANIVIVAVLSTPVPFRVFREGPANLLPSTFPYVWLPTFLVQAALFGHLVVFRALRSHGSR